MSQVACTPREVATKCNASVQHYRRGKRPGSRLSSRVSVGPLVMGWTQHTGYLHLSTLIIGTANKSAQGASRVKIFTRRHYKTPSDHPPAPEFGHHALMRVMSVGIEDKASMTGLHNSTT